MAPREHSVIVIVGKADEILGALKTIRPEIVDLLW
jgi:hypothetical protein